MNPDTESRDCKCMCPKCECNFFASLDDTVCNHCIAGNHRLTKTGKIRKRRKDSSVLVGYTKDELAEWV